MTLSRTATTLALSMLIIFSFVRAQAQDIMSPSIMVSGALYPSRSVTDTTGNYSHQRVSLDFTLPLLKKIKLDDSGIRFGLLSFSANTCIDNTNLSFINESRPLLMANVSLTGIYKSGKKSVWLGKLSGSSFEDPTTIRHPSIRLSGFALYKRSVRENFYYLAGGVYTFSFGRGLALPIIGAGWNFIHSSSLSLVLPLSINYRFGKPGNQYSVFVRPTGGFSNFANHNLYVNAPEEIIFRRREFTLGVRKKFKLSDHWSFFAEAGLLTARKISFNKDLSRDDSSIIFDSQVKRGAYLSVGLKFKFNTKDLLPDAGYQEQELGL